MAETPINNMPLGLNIKPANKPNLEMGESTLFSKKVDANLWESVSKKITPKKPKEDNIPFQILKAEQETQKYEQILSKSFGNKLDITG